MFVVYPDPESALSCSPAVPPEVSDPRSKSTTWAELSTVKALDVTAPLVPLRRAHWLSGPPLVWMLTPLPLVLHPEKLPVAKLLLVGCDPTLYGAVSNPALVGPPTS